MTTTAAPTRNDSVSTGRRIASAFRPVVTLIISTIVLLLVWLAFLRLFDVSPFFGKSPADVWHWLTTGEDAAKNRSDVFGGLRMTMRDALSGFVVGLGVSLVAAILFVLSRSIEQAFLPIAVAMRAVPILVLVPVLGRVFGRGLGSTVIVTSIIVFFPSLVIILHGLRSVSAESVDLMRAYDATTSQLLFKVRLPGSLPSIFAAAKVAAPSAIIGALLAEQFVTGKGLGYEMIKSRATAEFERMWAQVFLITFVAVLLYTLIGVVEQLVLGRFAPDAQS